MMAVTRWTTGSTGPWPLEGDRTQGLGWYPLIVLRQVPTQNTGGRSQTKPRGSCWVGKDRGCSSRRQRWLWFVGQNTSKGGGYTERYLEIHRVSPLVIGQGLICASARRDWVQGRQQALTEKEQEESPRPPQGCGKPCVPTSYSGKI